MPAEPGLLTAFMIHFFSSEVPSSSTYLASDASPETGSSWNEVKNLGVSAKGTEKARVES
jgi:hypothetical protein